MFYDQKQAYYASRPWLARAKKVQFYFWKGQSVYDMSEVEIQAAFSGLARDYGISYIWGSSI